MNLQETTTLSVVPNNYQGERELGKKMKPVYAVIISFSLLMLLGFSHARKNPAEDYWKQVVKGQAMPDAIRGRIHNEHASIPDFDDHRFSVDFDTRANAIIYHGRHGDHKETMIIKSFAADQEDQFDADHHEDEEDQETDKYT